MPPIFLSFYALFRAFSILIQDAVIYLGGVFMKKRYINERTDPGMQASPDLKLSEVIFDKSELIARGKVQRGGNKGTFEYSLYDGVVKISWEMGDVVTEKEMIRNHIRCCILDKVFPLAGRAFIGDLLAKENETIPMVNGFLQVNMEILPADVLLMLCDVTGHEQIFSKNGKYLLVKPTKGGYSILQENRATLHAKTYSDVIKLLGDDCKKVFDKSATEKAKERIYRPVRINDLFEGQVRERSI